MANLKYGSDATASSEPQQTTTNENPDRNHDEESPLLSPENGAVTKSNIAPLAGVGTIIAVLLLGMREIKGSQSH